ncbi:sodium-coupled monocarboxylate transporter 1-like [Gracilinanus agilis]|uniref:sodium-coupled monocarboxylate transporter 1-like n=1 Tax=Gracilinanus agilis TaxID=191870 RepID=UPI001CFDEB67|nr:sodium-coupled monocarboxylate transporter 1-like [Gracilinanus agilis]
MEDNEYLDLADYLVFFSMLLISALIGIYYAVTEAYETYIDLLMAGKKMTGYPVSLSLLASFLSAITVLGMPLEVYKYGAIQLYDILTYTIVIFIVGEVYLPVFYRLNIISTYEYLELRFNKCLRIVGSILFIVQMVLYSGLVICAPALAFRDVTGFGLRTAIFATGVVCTFYCTVGGLRAVIWTDFFQTLIMVSGFLTIIIKASILQGGISNIIKHSQQGGRLNNWDFDPNPYLDNSFWTIVIGGAFTWTGIFGINHCQVQRYTCCKSKFHAKLALYVNLMGLYIIIICGVLCGLSLYSIYHACDPYEAHQIKQENQIVPFLAVSILRVEPGLLGLFVSAAYSGTLSTVSSSINALAVVTIEDIIKPCLNDPSGTTLSILSKVICIFYGVICVVMAILSSLFGKLKEAVVIVFGMIGGPLLGLFTLGILNPFANAYGSVIGLIIGYIISLWLGIGSQLNPGPYELNAPLPVSIENCTEARTAYHNWTRVLEQPVLIPWKETMKSYQVLNFYWISHMYLSMIGTITTIFVGSIVSLITGGINQDVKRRFLLMKEDTILFYFKKPVEAYKTVSRSIACGGLQNCVQVYSLWRPTKLCPGLQPVEAYKTVSRSTACGGLQNCLQVYSLWRPTKLSPGL